MANQNTPWWQKQFNTYDVLEATFPGRSWLKRPQSPQDRARIADMVRSQEGQPTGTGRMVPGSSRLAAARRRRDMSGAEGILSLLGDPRLQNPRLKATLDSVSNPNFSKRYVSDINDLSKPQAWEKSRELMTQNPITPPISTDSGNRQSVEDIARQNRLRQGADGTSLLGRVNPSSPSKFLGTLPKAVSKVNLCDVTDVVSGSIPKGAKDWYETARINAMRYNQLNPGSRAFLYTGEPLPSTPWSHSKVQYL